MGVQGVYKPSDDTRVIPLCTGFLEDVTVCSDRLIEILGIICVFVRMVKEVRRTDNTRIGESRSMTGTLLEGCKDGHIIFGSVFNVSFFGEEIQVSSDINLLQFIVSSLDLV